MTLEALPDYLAHPAVVAIGEIGLETCSDVEERVFRAQLGIDYYPKVIHTPRRAKREVLERIIAIVDDVGAKDAALASELDKVMLIGTDKAVNPRNVIGATKLVAERLTISANYYKGSRKTAFSCVRFGNVLNSSGSVVPLFDKQMRERRCITIKDTSMTRFVTSISQGVDLKLQATMRGGEIFVLKMPAVNITDLARAVIAELGLAAWPLRKTSS